VAKMRHFEALHEKPNRLFYDPYAKDMYPGSFGQVWLGTSGTKRLYDLMGPGILEMLLIRTKWLDDQVMKAATSMKQMLILGAGYDTRGFRLDLPKENFQVWEVDQLEVQRKKISNLARISQNDSKVADLMDSFVKFIPVDFNVDALDEKLTNTEGFISKQSSLILLEGVTQYIPKSSTADTLKKIKAVVAPGSILLISYVDQNTFDDPAKVGPIKSSNNLIRIAKSVGEPWISSWTEEGFGGFLEDLGYKVLENTTAKDYNETYMEPLGRRMKNDEILSVERFVVAKIEA